MNTLTLKNISDISKKQRNKNIRIERLAKEQLFVRNSNLKTFLIISREEDVHGTRWRYREYETKNPLHDNEFVISNELSVNINFYTRFEFIKLRLMRKIRTPSVKEKAKLMLMGVLSVLDLDC